MASFEDFHKIYFKPVTDIESGDCSYLFINEDEEKAKETDQVNVTSNVGISTRTIPPILLTPRLQHRVKRPKRTSRSHLIPIQIRVRSCLQSSKKKKLSPIRPALFTSTPTRKPNSASNSVATGDYTDFLSSSIQQMHRELRRENQVC